MILDAIAAAARERIEGKKAALPLEKVKQEVMKINRPTGFPFEKALQQRDIGFICEVKKASPSRGVIAADFPYLQIARDYEAAGAEAISVLTEPQFFLGRDDYLAQIKDAVSIPLLRKDFVIDAYQVFEAKVLGAAAVLLIMSLMDVKTAREYLSICDELGLSALVEVHDEWEVEAALAAGSRVIGVNNRNLQDFSVDINNSVRLRSLVPKEILFVAESGIKTAADVAMMREVKVNAVLIGETLMRSPDKRAILTELRGQGR
jgi:indole-3-glycerol phosphate synthase